MTETLHAGEYLDLVARNDWEFVRRSNSTGVVAVAALTFEGELVLTRQYRVPAGKYVVDLAAGLIGDDGEPDETALPAAKRELLEETGYESRDWTELATAFTSPGLTDESVRLFFAKNAMQVDAGGGVGGEDIEVIPVPVGSVPEFLTKAAVNGDGVDLKVWAALGLLADDEAVAGDPFADDGLGDEFLD